MPPNCMPPAETGARPILRAVLLSIAVMLMCVLVGFLALQHRSPRHVHTPTSVSVPVQGAVDPYNDASVLSRIPVYLKPRRLIVCGANGTDFLTGATFSPDSTRLAITTTTGVTVWDLRTMGQVQKLTGATIDGTPIANVQFDQTSVFSPDGKRLLFGIVEPRSVWEWWDLPSGKLVRVLRDRRLGSDSTCLIRTVDDPTKENEETRVSDVEFYEMADGRRLGRVRIRNNRDQGYYLSQDRRRLAVGDAYVGATDGEIAIYDLRSGRRRMVLSDDRGEEDLHDGACGPMAFSPDGGLLVTNGGDPAFRVGHNPENPGGAVSEAATWRALPLKLWNLRTGRLLRMWSGQGMYSRPLFLRGGKRIASLGAERLDVWEAGSGKLVCRLRFSDIGISTGAQLAPDHRTLVFAERTSVILLTLPAALESITPGSLVVSH